MNGKLVSIQCYFDVSKIIWKNLFLKWSCIEQNLIFRCCLSVSRKTMQKHVSKSKAQYIQIKYKSKQFTFSRIFCEKSTRNFTKISVTIFPFRLRIQTPFFGYNEVSNFHRENIYFGFSAVFSSTYKQHNLARRTRKMLAVKEKFFLLTISIHLFFILFRLYTCRSKYLKFKND